jgi:hypothetical protein
VILPRLARAHRLAGAEPGAHHRHQLIDVDRLGDVVRGAGGEGLVSSPFIALAVSAMIGSCSEAGIERIARAVS